MIAIAPAAVPAVAALQMPTTVTCRDVQPGSPPRVFGAGVVGLDACAWLVVVFTFLICTRYDEILARHLSAVGVLLVRNGALVALIVVGVRHLVRAARPPLVPTTGSTPTSARPIEVL